MKLNELIKSLKEENVNLATRGGARATGTGSWSISGPGPSLSDLWDQK